MSIKHFCDECQAEIPVERFHALLTVKEMKEVMGTDAQKQFQTMRGVQERRVEFCEQCIGKLFPKIALA